MRAATSCLLIALAALQTACVAPAGQTTALRRADPVATVPAAAPITRPVPAALQVDAGASCRIPGLRESILQQINAARAKGGTCGKRAMPAAPPVMWNDALYAAAAKHSRDMAADNYFDHRDAHGRHVGERVDAEGYRWHAVAENIAGGDRSVDSVVRGWLRSPVHCEAMLDAQYADVAVACVARPMTEWGTYWTMVLGRR
jgi:uncharacterized protein YkwD